MQNEKYIGDALLQKTITTDFINHVRIKNDGTEPQYYVKDSHAPIIPRDIFFKVQEEMLRRANMFSGEENKKGEFIPVSTLYPACVFVLNAGMFTEELLGTTEGCILLSGVVAPEWKTVLVLAMLRQYKRTNCNLP